MKEPHLDEHDSALLSRLLSQQEALRALVEELSHCCADAECDDHDYITIEQVRIRLSRVLEEVK